MKHIPKLSILFLLLCSTVLLSDVIYMSQQQPFNPIVLDGVSISDNRSNTQCVTELSTPIFPATKHKHFRYHTANPQYSLDHMSTDQLLWFFTINNYTQEQILSYPLLYMRPAYLAIAKQLPKYSRYVKMYHDEYKKFNWFTKGLGRMLFIYAPKLQRQFALLWQECEEQRIAQEKCEQEQRELRIKQELEVRVRKDAEERAAYVKELECVERILRDRSSYQKISTNDHTARLDALTACRNNADRTLRKLQTGQDAIVFAQQYGIIEQQIANVMMNRYEYQLHKEYVNHIHSAMAIKRRYNIQEQNIFIDLLGNGIAIGIKSNHLHNSEWATRWSDFCYEATEIVRGIGDGVLLGSYNTVDMVMHPVRTLVRMIDGVRMLGSLTAHTVGTLAQWNYLIERGEYLQFATEVYEIGEQLINMSTAIHESTSQMSNRDIAKHITAFGTEWVLIGQMFIMGHTLCSNLGKTIKRTIKLFKDEGIAGEFALATTDGVLFKASENMQKGGGGAGNLIRDSQVIFETIHTQYMTIVEAELESLRLLCDNKVLDTANFGNKYLKPQYKHILGMELEFSRRGIPQIGGFHHDFMQAIEKSDVFRFVDKVVHESGFYSAELYYGENFVKNITFFPADWSRKQVIEVIYEAYTDFIQSGMKPVLESNGKYRVDAVFNKQVTIRMHITKDAVIKTAYPILK